MSASDKKYNKSIMLKRALEVSADTTKREVSEGIAEFLPFLRFLYEKRNDLYGLLSGVKEDGRIPRYAVPGMVRTKAIYMSDMIGLGGIQPSWALLQFNMV